MEKRKIILPTSGLEYLKKANKRSTCLTFSLQTYQESMHLYENRSKLSSRFERATVRHNLHSLVGIVKKLNEHELRINENKSIAIRLQLSTKEWIIHRNTACDEIEVKKSDEMTWPFLVEFLCTFSKSNFRWHSTNSLMIRCA